MAPTAANTRSKSRPAKSTTLPKSPSRVKISQKKKNGPKTKATPADNAPPLPQSNPARPSGPSTSELLDKSKQTADDWYKSTRTKKGYANYVKSGKKFVSDWAAEERVDGEETSTSEEIDKSELEDAFDVISSKTPIALRLITAYKCEHQGNKFSTAEGLRSAFKDYFERVHGCYGEVWKFDSQSKKWEGNPVFESNFKVYFESLKNRDKRTGESTQALPMLPKDLKVITDYLDSSEATTHFTETRRLYFKAFATTAFTLWTRNDELINLQYKHVKPGQRSSSGLPYVEFQLVFRKTNKDPNKIQKYEVPPDLEHPEIDCYTHITNWLSHLQGLLQRPLEANDYVFPAIASTGQIKFGEGTSRTGFESLLDEVIEESGLMKGRHGKFTTHCFRRGGAQYRFMWARRKWSLKAVKWWGGWSSSENVGTIMRYLLDELMVYEEGFSDIMMGDRASDRHESFMGAQDATAAVSKHDLADLEEKLVHQFRAIIASQPTPSGLSQSNHENGVSQCLNVSIQRHIPVDPLLTSPSRSSPAAQPILTVSHRTPPHSTPIPPTHEVSIRLQPSRIPVAKSLDDALRYWNEGDLDKGLMVPLKDWAELFVRADYLSEEVKYGNIKFVCAEFIVQCKEDWDLFETRYPALRHRYTKLVLAVRSARKARNETKPRSPRKT